LQELGSFDIKSINGGFWQGTGFKLTARNKFICTLDGCESPLFYSKEIWKHLESWKHLCVNLIQRTYKVLINDFLIFSGAASIKFGSSWRPKDHVEELLVNAIKGKGSDRQYAKKLLGFYLKSNFSLIKCKVHLKSTKLSEIIKK